MNRRTNHNYIVYCMDEMGSLHAMLVCQSLLVQTHLTYSLWADPEGEGAGGPDPPPPGKSQTFRVS